MKDINLIDSCQAHLPVQYASKSNSFARSDTDVVIDSEPHSSCTCKTSLLFAPLAVRVHTGCSALLFYSYTPTKPFIRVHIKNKTVFPQIINIFYIIDFL